MVSVEKMRTGQILKEIRISLKLSSRRFGGMMRMMVYMRERRVTTERCSRLTHAPAHHIWNIGRPYWSGLQGVIQKWKRGACPMPISNG